MSSLAITKTKLMEIINEELNKALEEALTDLQTWSQSPEEQERKRQEKEDRDQFYAALRAGEPLNIDEPDALEADPDPASMETGSMPQPEPIDPALYRKTIEWMVKVLLGGKPEQARAQNIINTAKEFEEKGMSKQAAVQWQSIEKMMQRLGYPPDAIKNMAYQLPQDEPWARAGTIEEIIREETQAYLEEVYSDKQRRWACAQANKPAGKRKKSLSKKEADEMCKGPKLKPKSKRKKK
jgi:hypothetical protein